VNEIRVSERLYELEFELETFFVRYRAQFFSELFFCSSSRHLLLVIVIYDERDIVFVLLLWALDIKNIG